MNDMSWYIVDNSGSQIDLGNVYSERFPPKANLDHVTFPLSASSEAFVYDYNGVTRVITIKGRKGFDTLAEVWNWIGSIDELINGDQNPRVFHSDGWNNSTTNGNYKDGNFNVKIESFDPIVKEGIPLLVDYTLILFEGS